MQRSWDFVEHALNGRRYPDDTAIEFRDLLTVPTGNLKHVSDLNEYAIAEVHGLSDFGVQVRPLKEGRRVTRIRLACHRKSKEELKAAFAELQRCMVGRKVRLVEESQSIHLRSV